MDRKEIKWLNLARVHLAPRKVARSFEHGDENSGYVVCG
jgi:hypothetical protein